MLTVAPTQSDALTALRDFLVEVLPGGVEVFQAQVISTAFRDSYAVDFFATVGDAAVPLYAGDPRQMAFIDENQQYEDRWVIDAHLQTNPVVRVPQQFAGAVEVGLVEVDAAFPP